LGEGVEGGREGGFGSPALPANTHSKKQKVRRTGKQTLADVGDLSRCRGTLPDIGRHF
jgi:hypothetical protein